MQSRSSSFAKYIFVFFNLIFLVSGVAVLGIGIWIRADPNMVHMQNLVQLDQNDKYLTYGSWILIGFGGFVLLVGIFGCVGGLTRNKCFLGMYIFFLLLIFGGEFAGGVLAAVFKHNVEGTLKGTLKNSFKDYDPMAPNSLVVQGWSWMQDWIGCCGSQNFRDYKNVTFINTVFVPYSCCKSDNNNLTLCQTEAKTGMSNTNMTFDYLNNQGCFDDLNTKLEDHVTLLIGVGIGIAFVQLLGIIIACCLCRAESDGF